MARGTRIERGDNHAFRESRGGGRTTEGTSLNFGGVELWLRLLLDGTRQEGSISLL